MIFIISFAIYSKSHPSNTKYPEGDSLLKEWREQELEDIRSSTEEVTPEDAKKRSIFDDESNIDIPTIENTYNGGFKINTDAFDEDK